MNHETVGVLLSRPNRRSIGVGFGASAMFAILQLQHPLVAPGAAYYLLIAAGIAASLGIIAATFPLLRRITGPEVARNE